MPLPGPARPRLIRSGHDFSRRFVERTAGLNPRLSRKERRRQKRREKKQARQVELLGIEHDAEGQVRTGAGLTFGQRLARVLTAFLMMGGACTVIGILTGEAEVAAVSLGVITLALLGIGVAHAIANYIGPDHPWLIDRVLTVACAAPAVGLLYTFQSEPGMPGVEKLLGRAQPQVPLLAALALLDWRQRIRQGHEGELGWWPAYIAAVVPWVGTMVLDHGNWNAALYLGGLGASVSLLLQVWAWALASSPRPHGAHPDAAASPRTAPGQDETQWAPPPQSAPPGVKVYEAEGSRAKVRVELGMPGSWRPAAGGTSSEAVPAGPDPGRVRRGRLARGVAWVCCVTFGLETLALIWLICRGAFDYEQTAVAIVAACAAMMTSWMALGKTHPLRRPGRWSEWFNPALRILAGSTLAGGVCVLSMFHLGEGQLAAAITMVVLSSLALLFLLIVRRRRPRAVDVMQVPAMHRAAGAPAVEPAGRPDSADSPEANDFIIPAPARKS
jgi:VIT1/CCC1 family predicted Fe2+/Mn2+ transporter